MPGSIKYMEMPGMALSTSTVSANSLPDIVDSGDSEHRIR
jgi:hypothetical protein